MSKKMKIILAVVGFYAFSAIMLALFGEEQQPAPTQSVSNKTEASEQVSETETDSNTPKIYIETEVDPVLKSVAATVDTTWQYYFTEPIEHFVEDGDYEAYSTDLNLCKDLFAGTISKIDGLEVPEYLNSEDKEIVNRMKAALKNSVNARIEVIDMALELNVAEEKMFNKIAESNALLQKATSEYNILYNKYFK